MAKKIFRTDSFLKNATDINGIFLDVNEVPAVPANINDESYVINAAYSERPDLLAYSLYGTTRLWWVFAVRNPDVLVDPIRDFKEGLTIMLPSPETINTIAGNSR